MASGDRRLVVLPSLAEMKRRPYSLHLNSLDERWIWVCPVCGWRVSEVEKKDTQTAANAHACDAGWCTVPARTP